MVNQISFLQCSIKSDINHEQRQEVPGVPERENENSKESSERVDESIENA